MDTRKLGMEVHEGALPPPPVAPPVSPLDAETPHDVTVYDAERHDQATDLDRKVDEAPAPVSGTSTPVGLQDPATVSQDTPASGGGSRRHLLLLRSLLLRFNGVGERSLTQKMHQKVSSGSIFPAERLEDTRTPRDLLELTRKFGSPYRTRFGRNSFKSGESNATRMLVWSPRGRVAHHHLVRKPR